MVSKRKFLGVALATFVTVNFTGCGLLDFETTAKPQFEVTPLRDEAKPISFSPSKPYGCMIVGEREGKANASGTRGATKELLRTSARNDLRNEATHLIQLGQSKRFLVYISKETAICDLQGREVNCASIPVSQGQQEPLPRAYRVFGEVYECKW